MDVLDRVVEHVRLCGADGCYSSDVVSSLGMHDDKYVLEVLSACSFRPVGVSNLHAVDKPLVRYSSKKDNFRVRYIHKCHYYKPEDNMCPLCGDVLESWQVIGGDYTNSRFVSVFRQVIALTICEYCFRSHFLGDTTPCERVGFAVLPHDFVHTQELELESKDADTFFPREKILDLTVTEVCNFGVRGGTWDDVFAKVGQAILPHTMDNLKDIVQYSLHISSSKTLKTSKPLLRRALIGFDGDIQVLFVSKEFIDPAPGEGNEIRLDIAEQSVPGAMFGLRAYTVFRIYVASFDILRRYSDFVWLRDELVRSHGSEAMIPPLPRKRFLGRFNNHFLETRMHALEHFLSIVTTHPVLHKAKALAAFFRNAPFEKATADYRPSSPAKRTGILTTTTSNAKRVVAPDCQKALKKCYKYIEKLNKIQLGSATAHENLATAVKALAEVEIPEIKEYANVPRREEKGFHEVPLSGEDIPTPYCALALIELLSSLSRLSVLAGTADRALYIRTSGIKMHLKEWHRSVDVFKDWFDNRLHTVRLLNRSMSLKRSLFIDSSNPDENDVKRTNETISEMQTVVKQTEKDVVLESEWLLQRNKQEIVSHMISYVNMQVEHARQMSKMWQDFLPQVLVSLETQFPIEEDVVTTYSEDEEEEEEDMEELDASEIAFGECIGRGTFGEVHSGVYHGQRVAVKTFPTAMMSEKTLRGFAREASVMKRLPPHPNLISFFGMCSKPGNVCLVMELVESGSMLQILLDKNFPAKIPSRSEEEENDASLNHITVRRKRSNKKDWQLKLALGAATGIRVLHNSRPQILHRDIKTSNLLVTRPQLTVKVCDFGLARVKLENQSVKSFVGTASWVAPEVIMSKKDGYSTKADVYSFGLVLWQIYARRQPYPNLHATQVLFQVARERLRPEMPQNVPQPIEKLIRRCWHPDPNARPDFDEICEMLESL
mmetsp:Transcript_34618/g.55333  ORF Transcript_34618/g.55333 Transcript_34618/m.55333 type:complete len:945 (+) Transcript_34618:428-3262(+)